MGGTLKGEVLMKATPLNEKDLKDLLLSHPLIARLGTVSPKGEVRITPIWFGHQDGSFLMNTFEDSTHVRSIRRNPRCSLLIDSLEWPYVGVHYWGTANIEGPENDAEGIAKLFAPYVGSVEAAMGYARQLISYGKRVYLRFRPERKVTWDFRA